jgi:hypothetical protein
MSPFPPPPTLHPCLIGAGRPRRLDDAPSAASPVPASPTSAAGIRAVVQPATTRTCTSVGDAVGHVREYGDGALLRHCTPGLAGGERPQEQGEQHAPDGPVVRRRDAAAAGLTRDTGLPVAVCGSHPGTRDVRRPEGRASASTRSSTGDVQPAGAGRRSGEESGFEPRAADPGAARAGPSGLGDSSIAATPTGGPAGGLPISLRLPAGDCCLRLAKPACRTAGCAIVLLRAVSA